jgi:hypothetical protein
MKLLESKGWVKTARYDGSTPCSFMITYGGPQLTRWLRDGGSKQANRES